LFQGDRHDMKISTMNIRRYLPLQNPVIPRRVRPSCPKNSLAKIIEPVKLIVTQQEISQASLIDHQDSDELWGN
jgi:hypothetical protein